MEHHRLHRDIGISKDNICRPNILQEGKGEYEDKARIMYTPFTII
jgi:hypothetical protein